MTIISEEFTRQGDHVIPLYTAGNTILLFVTLPILTNEYRVPGV